jgi:hypothetical protein
MVNNDTHANLTEKQVPKMLKKYQAAAAKKESES